jgi:hypothetical protein
MLLINLVRASVTPNKTKRRNNDIMKSERETETSMRFFHYRETLVEMAASTTVVAAFSAANTTASPLFSLFQTFNNTVLQYY